jgi:hypothetical protein
MTHEHGSQFRVRIVRENETEEVSGWMNHPDEISQIVTGLRGPTTDAYWLQVRNILCPNCQHTEQTIVESQLNLNVTENTRIPPQPERRDFRSVSSRRSSAGA